MKPRVIPKRNCTGRLDRWGTDELIDDVITRMCESLSRGLARKGERLQGMRDVDRTSIVWKPIGEQIRLITAALTANPKADVATVANEVGTGTSYVYNIRKRLRAEGRIS